MTEEPDALREDAQTPYKPKGGEDESSTEHDGNDNHLHEDQKPTTK